MPVSSTSPSLLANNAAAHRGNNDRPDGGSNNDSAGCGSNNDGSDSDAAGDRSDNDGPANDAGATDTYANATHADTRPADTDHPGAGGFNGGDGEYERGGGNEANFVHDVLRLMTVSHQARFGSRRPTGLICS